MKKKRKERKQSNPMCRQNRCTCIAHGFRPDQRKIPMLVPPFPVISTSLLLYFPFGQPVIIPQPSSVSRQQLLHSQALAGLAGGIVKPSGFEPHTDPHFQSALPARGHHVLGTRASRVKRVVRVSVHSPKPSDYFLLDSLEWTLVPAGGLATGEGKCTDKCLWFCNHIWEYPWSGVSLYSMDFQISPGIGITGGLAETWMAGPWR